MSSGSSSLSADNKDRKLPDISSAPKDRNAISSPPDNQNDAPPPPYTMTSYAELKRLIKDDEERKFLERTQSEPAQNSGISWLANLVGLGNLTKIQRPFTKSENLLLGHFFQKGFQALGKKQYTLAEEYYLRVIARMPYNGNVLQAEHTFDKISLRHEPNPEGDRYHAYSINKLYSILPAQVTAPRIKLALAWIHICQGRFKEADQDLAEAQQERNVSRTYDSDFPVYYWYLVAEGQRRRQESSANNQAVAVACKHVLDSKNATEHRLPYVAAVQMMCVILRGKGEDDEAAAYLSCIPDAWPKLNPDAYLTLGDRMF